MLSAEAINAMSGGQLVQAAAELFDPELDETLRAELTALMRVRAAKEGIDKAFEKLLSDYSKQEAKDKRAALTQSMTAFSWAPIALRCGEWDATEGGVYGRDSSGRPVTACRIPILPTAILRNVMTGVENIELMFKKHGIQTIVTDRETVSSTQKIVRLANNGVEVTSETAKNLVRYISDCVTLNLDALPHLRSTSNLGWINKDEFAPYCDVRFDADREYKHLFDSVCSQGALNDWIDFVRPLRENLYVRLLLAASFASVLVEPCGCLPFVLHLWGSTGTGKTVSLMVAMSVWGDPEMGRLTRTMNMTANSMMSTAAFLNNLPFAGDELQTIKEKWGNYDDLIMKVCEGIDRGRMNYDKVLPTKSWRNSFIFTGEEPCLRAASGGGAKNRVIQVKLDGDIVTDGNKVANFVRDNYGSAGRAFIDYIIGAGWESVRERFTTIFRAIINSCDTTDKQAMAAALLLLGDELSDEVIWKTGKPMQLADIRDYLFTAQEIDVAARAYDFSVQLIAQNAFRFVRGDEKPANGEVWGRIDADSTALINQKVLSEKLTAEGYDFDAVKGKWAQTGALIRYDDARLLHRTFVMGVRAYFVKLALPKEEEKAKQDAHIQTAVDDAEADESIPEWVQEIMQDSM